MPKGVKMPKVVLTGIKTSGMPHLGNYIGAILPAMEGAKETNVDSYFFVADYHALTTVHDASFLKQKIREVSATWLACGLDPDKTIFYRQSDIPELFELNWILSCMTPKGLMNRGHSYKAITQFNRELGRKNLEDGVNMGIYNYPILMSSDILLFAASEVPVSEDQAQHLEITRDIAIKFNHTFKTDILTIPKTVIQSKLLPGLDGEKMSKSKNNYIPLFCSSKELRKTIMKIKTDSSDPNTPKDPEKSILFSIYKAFASTDQTQALVEKYQKGIGWGIVKEMLYNLLEEHLSDKRKIYNDLIAQPKKIDLILEKGAKKARQKGAMTMKNIREIVGISQY